MENRQSKKIWIDLSILIVSCLGVFAVWKVHLSKRIVLLSGIAFLLVGGVVLIDLLRQLSKSHNPLGLNEQAATGFSACELILLNEDERPIRAWQLTGKTAMVIGRKNRNEEVDVDLSDCEYSALINIQHAVLNYCLDAWYIEDLASQNGVRIKKVEDGCCYQVAPSHPCKIAVGDVIYIAKTKLLFT